MKSDESVEQQRTHFNEISDKYFTARQSPNHLHLKMLIWRYFLQRNHFLAAEVTRVLEPMCGMGEGYSILKSNLKTDFNYLGFDYSENMVSLAKTANPSLDIIWNDVTKFSHSGESVRSNYAYWWITSRLFANRRSTYESPPCIARRRLFFKL